MAEPDFLVKLTHFANTEWSSIRLGHSVGTFDEEYPCANPDGPVDNSECPDDDPFCNCPECTKHLDPKISTEYAPWYVDVWKFFTGGGDDVTEPTDKELRESAQSIKECDLIKSVLGESWLGCMWKNQEHPSSCDCPCVGEDFKKYIEYTRTSATYWDTPVTTPLWRDAQMMLINSQASVIVLNGDLSLRPGKLINITNKNVSTERERRFSGRWLIANISHTIQSSQHKMILTLVRDSSPIDPNTSEELGFFASVWGWFFG